jgi:hypothetical protein
MTRRTFEVVRAVEVEPWSTLYFGQGYMRARDRQIQTLLMQAIFTGRMSELLRADDTLIAIDTYMRRYAFALAPRPSGRSCPRPAAPVCKPTHDACTLTMLDDPCVIVSIGDVTNTFCCP